MKPLVVISVLWTAVFLCAGARAQDKSRVPDPDHSVKEVDRSVHADTQEPALADLELLQKPTKAPTYSRWGFPAADQTPVTQFWPAPAAMPTRRAEDEGTAKPERISLHSGTQLPRVRFWPASDSVDSKFQDHHEPSIKPQVNSDFVNLEGKQDSVKKGTFSRSDSGSKEPESFRTKVPALPPQPEADGLSTPFRAKRFGSTGVSSSPFNAFPSPTPPLQEKRIPSKMHKRSTQKSSSNTNKTTPLESGQKQETFKGKTQQNF